MYCLFFLIFHCHNFISVMPYVHIGHHWHIGLIILKRCRTGSATHTTIVRAVYANWTQKRHWQDRSTLIQKNVTAKGPSHLSTRYGTHNGHLLPLDRNAINCLSGLEFFLTCTIVHADHRSDTVSGQGHDVNFARVSFRTSFKAMMALLDH